MGKFQLNERLRELRIKCGYTQAQVAQILNIDRSTYSYYEIGKTRPDITVLVKLSRIFNIPINEMLLDERNPEAVADSGVAHFFTRGRKNVIHIYELSDAEKELIGAFRVCTPEDQKLILEYVNEKKNGKG